MDIIETAQSLNVEKLPNLPNNQIIKANIIPNQQKSPSGQIIDNTTTISNINFLKINNKDQIIEKLNEKISKDTISTSTGTSSNNSQQEINSSKKSLAGRTKEWAGNIWNSLKNIKLKNIFPKTEYKEFRNANGDLVKIPVKKIPLKKKNNLNEKVKNMISNEKNKDINSYNDAAQGMYIFY